MPDDNHGGLDAYYSRENTIEDDHHGEAWPGSDSDDAVEQRASSSAEEDNDVVFVRDVFRAVDAGHSEVPRLTLERHL